MGAGESVFRRDGEDLVPGPLAQGPWYEGSLHGSAMLAALAWAAEGHPADVPRQVTRLTVDMIRAAPLAPLRPVTRCVRSGKNVDFLDLELYGGEELFVRGTALRTRAADVTPAPDADDHVAVPTLPERDPFVFEGAEDRPGFHHALEIRVGGDDVRPVVWFRLAAPIVEGEENSGFVTMATVADWTYAVPTLERRSRAAAEGAAPVAETAFSINVDTTVQAVRPMTGDWLGLASTVTYGNQGSGASSARIFDQEGIVGFSSQSALVRGLDGAPLRLKEVPDPSGT